MPDPLEALRQPADPIEPDPFFAAHLRARLVRALELPRGVTVSDLAQGIGPGPDAGATALVPYLIVADARRAIDWYSDALGARRQGDAVVMADGRIGHAELRVGDAIFYLADESPASEVSAPRPGEGATVSLTLSVADVDGVTTRAVRSGARLERAPADYPHGRDAVVRDPFGHRWILAAALPRLAPAPSGQVREGDLAYVSLWVPDGPRAAAFFGEVLDWAVIPGDTGRAAQVRGLSLPHGILGGQPASTLFLCFVVDSADDAAARVRDAGGQTGRASDQPYGRAVDCVDSQGTRFALVEVPAEERGPRAAINGDRHGDISYLTMGVEDSAEARAFYGAVFGWAFHPGYVADGWEVDGVVPMLGMHGGDAQSTVVPMYRVDDIHRAVARVRALGGQATDPAQQPYGVTAECVDDQGTRFYLAQHEPATA